MGCKYKLKIGIYSESDAAPLAEPAKIVVTMSDSVIIYYSEHLEYIFDTGSYF